jgi:ABC-type transport system involved in multi-copper enzyme maturation permease subunit
MTPIATAPGAAPDVVHPRLPGLRNLLRKDTGEWVHGLRPWVVMVASTIILLLTAANGRIVEWAMRIAPEPGAAGDLPSLVPLDNLLMAVGTQTIVFAAIGATMGLLVAERDRGTLAWTASKPVSRTSILVSLWVTSTAMLWLAGVVVPLLATTALVTVLYGAPDAGTVLVLGVGLAAVPALFVAITLAASTMVSSTAAVAAIGVAALVVATMLGGLVPAIVPLLPTSIFSWVVAVATGGPVSPVTPVAWAAGLALLLVLGRQRLAVMEL